MLYTIYFGQKPLILTTVVSDDTQTRFAKERVVIATQTSENTIPQLLNSLKQPDTDAAILVCTNVPDAFEALKEQFQFLQAAGGLVWPDNKKLLLIFRKGKWDLPKGKLDPGESLEQCAVREVEEETGLRNVAITTFLCRTFHTYYQDGIHCLKESHWYLMHAPQTENLQPQTEEDIEQCIWVSPAELNKYLTNTHASIQDVLTAAMPLLTGIALPR